MSEPMTPVTSPAIREPHYERVALTTLGAGGNFLAVQNMAEAVSVAQLMSRSGVAIRKHLRDNPGACLGILMQALRWEFDPYMVANKSYAVNDQIAYEAQLIMAVVLTRAAIVDEPDYTYAGEPGKTRTCTITFKMKSGKTLSYTTPEVQKIPTKNSPLWKSDEDQQLAYFAGRSWARRHQPHVLLGVYTPEEAEHNLIDVTPKTSGVMERLPGEQAGDGFDHEGVAAATEQAAPKAARGKPRVPRTPLPAEVEPPPVQTDPAAQDAGLGALEMGTARPTSTEAPAETAGAPSAEPGQDKQASAEPASEVSPEAGADSSPSLPADAAAEMDFKDVIAEGYPAPDEVYMLNGDEWAWNAERGHVRRDTYKNGEPFSDAGRDKGLKIYEDHAQETSAPEAEAEAEAEAPESTFPPEFEAYIKITENGESWAEIKTGMAAFQKTPVWAEFTNETANHVRATTWATLSEREVEWLPDPKTDISAFRLWVEDCARVYLIKETLEALQATPEWPTKPEAMKAGILAAAAARIAAILEE